MPGSKTSLDSVSGESTEKETVIETVEENVSDANKTPSTFLPALGKLVSTSVYTGAYFASFGVTLSVLLAVKMLPTNNAVANGVHDGAESAKKVINNGQENTPSRNEETAI